MHGRAERTTPLTVRNVCVCVLSLGFLRNRGGREDGLVVCVELVFCLKVEKSCVGYCMGRVRVTNRLCRIGIKVFDVAM